MKDETKAVQAFPDAVDAGLPPVSVPSNPNRVQVLEFTDSNTAQAATHDGKVTSISQRKREANRQNALRSTGPNTKAGKSRSRWNALQHGLLAKHVPLDHWAIDKDDRETFRMLLKELIAHFEPVGPIEGILVERIAQSYWRLGRIQRVENAQTWLGLASEEKSELEGLRKYGSLEEDSAETEEAFRQARKSFDRLGYVDAKSLELILEEVESSEHKGVFVAANAKVFEFVRLRNTDHSISESEKHLKDAQTALARSLDVCESNAQDWNKQIDINRQKVREAYYSVEQSVSEYSVKNLFHYESGVERQFYRALAELERLQRQRLGDAVPPPLKLTM
jgi:hypothetical protein